VKLCTKVDYKLIKNSATNIFYMLKTTNMATVQNFEISYEKFKVVRILCTRIYAYEYIVKWYSYYSSLWLQEIDIRCVSRFF
jgi:hypothetical protein